MTTPPPDYAASPTLTAIRDVAGDAAALKLIAARGGTSVHLPMRLREGGELVKIVGVTAARAILGHFGGGAMLRIPTGRGFAHGRRIDHAEVVRLSRSGLSVKTIALRLGCTDRQIAKILAKAKPAPSRAQRAFF